MNRKWNRVRAAKVPQALLEASDHRPLVAQVLANRGILDGEAARRFLDPDAYRPAPPESLHDLEAGVERIEAAIRGGEHILVWGDFDVDGQTSTALFVSMLRRLGARVSFHIPVREHESHGIEPAVLGRYIEAGFDLLLTCDTGIAAVDGIALARQAGIDAVVTDHHDLPARLPDALALVDPKFHDEDHALNGLPGVGVAYKVLEALFARAGREAELEDGLDLVAIGIVADVALQRADTRYLLQRGLEVLRHTRRPGLLALMARAGLDPALVNDEDIGFQLGPRLNAVGRLADANVAVPLLTTTDEAEARRIVEDLERLNEERRFETAVVYDSAMAQIQQEPSLRQYAALVLANPTWHEGVIGIVASQLVEEFGKPAILLATPAGKPARGSARSVEGYHITQAIATQSHMLTGYGGHPMAAGLSMATAEVEALRRGVSKALVEQRTGRAPEPTLEVELQLPLADLALETAQQLEALAPFGAGNPPVNILTSGVYVEEVRPLGKEKAHRKLIVSAGGQKREVLWWRGAEGTLPEGGPLDLVVRVRPGVYRGKQTASITLQGFRRSEGAASDVRRAPAVVVVDCRAEPAPEACLARIAADAPGAQIWGEGSTPGRMRSRSELAPAADLVVWTAPPSQAQLAAALTRVEPKRVYLFARDPGLDTYDAFTRRLAGLVKYALTEYEGRTWLARLAGAMAHSERTVACGLELLPAMGVRATHEPGGVVRLERCEIAESPPRAEALGVLLEEARAFRKALRTSATVDRFVDGGGIRPALLEG